MHEKSTLPSYDSISVNGYPVWKPENGFMTIVDTDGNIRLWVSWDEEIVLPREVAIEQVKAMTAALLFNPETDLKD